MGWFSLLKGLVSLAGRLAKWLSDRQLIEAGEAKAINNGLYDAKKKIERADAARRNARVDKLRSDKNNRTGRK